MATLPETIILWWLFYSSLHDFHLIVLPNNNDGLKQEGVSQIQRIGAIDAFKNENARHDFAAVTEKNEKQYVRLQLKVYPRDPRAILPCISQPIFPFSQGGFTYNPAVQCDVQV